MHTEGSACRRSDAGTEYTITDVEGLCNGDLDMDSDDDTITDQEMQLVIWEREGRLTINTPGPDKVGN